MAFGMKSPVAADFNEIVKYDAKAGRMFRVDYDHNTREKVQVDITTPPPRFAIDFGSLEVGYGHFSPTGPDLRVVPEGQPLPPQPTDKDDKGRLMFRPVFRLEAVRQGVARPARMGIIRERGPRSGRRSVPEVSGRARSTPGSDPDRRTDQNNPDHNGTRCQDEHRLRACLRHHRLDGTGDRDGCPNCPGAHATCRCGARRIGATSTRRLGDSIPY